MAHLIDSMFSVRETPWHGLGTIVEEVLCSEDAIKKAGLDWQVTTKPVFVDGKQVKGYYANTRSDNNNVLGIVSDRYRIVQNSEAFSFTDNLLENEVKYETAGSLSEGKKVWLLAKMPEIEVVGDITVPYLVFTNSHDGKGSIRVALTPIRVVCNNTLNLALNNTPRMWSTKHIGSMEEKLEEAKITLGLATKYINDLKITAEDLARKSLTDKIVDEMIEELFPLSNDTTNRKRDNVIELRTELLARYNNAPDLQNFRGTAWGFVNAVSDFVTHTQPKRQTDTYQERMFEKVVNGHPVIDLATKLVA